MAQSTLRNTKASQMEAPSKAPSRRRADIQGLRAIAVVVVVLFHAGLVIPGGFVGVDVFFVISGFVITQMLLREFDAAGTINFRRFFVRRFKRLTPALVLVLVATLTASIFLQSPLGEQKVTAATAIGGLIMGANAVIFQSVGGYFEPSAEASPLLHIWSLSVEEQFYVVFPFFFLGCLLLGRRLIRRRWVPAILLVLVTIASVAIAMAVAAGAALPIHPFLTSYYSPLTRAWEFGVGALVAIIPVLRTPKFKAIAISSTVVGLGLLATSFWAINESVPFPGPATLLPVLGTALLLIGGGHSSNRINQALGSRVLVFLGNVSYSWYLWHWPAITFVAMIFPGSPAAKAAAGILSLLPAVLSYYWVEEPVRRMEELSKLGFARLAAIVVAPVLVMSAVLFFGAIKGWGLDRVQSIQAEHPGWSSCMSMATIANGPDENPSYSGCGWNVAQTGEPVFLVGDSNAAQFSGPLIEATATDERPFMMRTAGGCPFIDVYIQRGDTFDQPDQLCRDYYESTLKWLKGQDPGVVFISSTEGYWFESSMLVGASTASVDVRGRDRSAALQAGLDNTVRALNDSGHEVVLIQALPHPSFAGYTDVPDRCSLFELAEGDCELTVPRAEIESVQAPARSTIETVARANGATVLDLRKYFCNQVACSMNKDGELLYQDSLHLTVEASRSFAPDFSAVLDQAVGLAGDYRPSPS